MIVTLITVSGKETINLNDKSISWLLENGYDTYITGNYIFHRINIACGSQEQLIRFASCYMTAGFSKACDAHLWSLARYLTGAEMAAGRLIQDDYDLIDGMLPE